MMTIQSTPLRESVAEEPPPLPLTTGSVWGQAVLLLGDFLSLQHPRPFLIATSTKKAMGRIRACPKWKEKRRAPELLSGDPVGQVLFHTCVWVV